MMSKAELEVLVEKYEAKAERAFRNFQDTGIRRHDRERRNAEELTDCDTELDVKCKVLEWLSRDAYKSTPFHRVVQNIKFRRFIFDGICKFLGHDFSFEDMEEIYTHIGNRANHAKTVRFIESGYDLSVLKEG